MIPRESVLLVTGGANGIGLATAALWAEAGGQVAILDIHDCRQAAERIGPAALGITADVTDEEAVRAALEAVSTRFGRLDAVFNNAGILGAPGHMDALSLDEWNRVMAVCATGPFLVTKHALPYLKQAGGGAIIMNASISAIHGSVSHPAYSAAKGAIMSLSASLARQLGRFRIRVNCICPGSIDGTGLGASGQVPPLTAEQRIGMISRIPLGRIGAPEDIARTVLFLASGAARHITGAVLRVDGGELAGR